VWKQQPEEAGRIRNQLDRDTASLNKAEFSNVETKITEIKLMSDARVIDSRIVNSNTFSHAITRSLWYYRSPSTQCARNPQSTTGRDFSRLPILSQERVSPLVYLVLKYLPIDSYSDRIRIVKVF